MRKRPNKIMFVIYVFIPKSDIVENSSGNLYGVIMIWSFIHLFFLAEKSGKRSLLLEKALQSL